MIWDNRVWDELNLAEKIDRIADELFNVSEVETDAYEMRWAIYYKYLRLEEVAKEARNLLAKLKRRGERE